MFRVVQISDTHIGRDRARFARNWASLREWIDAQQPDAVHHCGDLTLDGADNEADFELCAQLAGTLTAPFRAVPGNHDIGMPCNARQIVDDVRLARWRRYLGADRWFLDAEDWRLMGLNTMLLGSGRAEEEDQYSWLEARMAEAGPRRIAWFCHQPLFIHGFDDGDNGYWSVVPEPRSRLEALSKRFDIGLVCSGHLHRERHATIGDTQYVWCPSTSFTVGDAQSHLPGTAVLGAAILEFDGRALRVQQVRLPKLPHVWIEDVAAEIYPR